MMTVLVTSLLVNLAMSGITPAAVSQKLTKTSFPLPELVTITFWECWGGAIGDFFDEEVERFRAHYPQITIEVSHFSDYGAYRETLALAFVSGNAPDTFIRGHRFNQLIENGWIQPLDPWITPEWVARFPEHSFAETRNMWHGKIYSFTPSITGYSRVLFINEDLFRAAGLVGTDDNIQIPKTWSDLRKMAAQITKTGNGRFYGIGIGIKEPRNMSWWFDMACLGGAPMRPYDFDFRTGEYVYSTHPAYAQIIKLLLGMKEDGSVYPYESTIDDNNIYLLFAQGKFGMCMSNVHAVNNLRRDFPDFQNYRIIPLPVPDEGQTGNMYILPGQGHFFISSQTKHPDEAWLWIDWLASRGYHQRMVAKGLGFSIFTDLNTPETIPDPHQAQAYAAQNNYGVYCPFPPIRNPHTARVRPKRVVPDVGELLIGIYTGQIKDWKQALIELDARKKAAFETAIQKLRDSGVDVSLEDFIFPDWDPMKDYVTQPQR